MTDQRGNKAKRRLRRWLTVEILVPSKFAEPVSNFLLEQETSGIEEISEDPEMTRLKAYFEEDRKRKEILPVLLRYLKSLQKIHAGTFSYQMKSLIIPEKDWGEKWKQFFKPVQVTPKIIVKPSWRTVRLKKGQFSVEINPGVAFGTGTHATTKLCIKALERSLKRKGLSVLDVGTGSGILSIVSAMLGAREAWGVDPDEASVENARENAMRNHVSRLIKIRKGTIKEVRKEFNIVVANIDLKVLIKMRWPLIRHVRPEGTLILSGILEGEKERIRRHYLETGMLKNPQVTQLEEWVCLIFRKRETGWEKRK